ncbi:sensor histidine kinase [Parasediminibacterium sp. JCM 36343]|uniref:sensor histidine kinase n=1 Tax=Parasediminibacterium sp. JCM 36343 TaxID=3374279 RepID=UPI00397B01B0
MKKRLYTIALITSPIIAVYGVSPIFIFDKVNQQYFLEFAGVLTFHIFLFWVMNIYLISKDHKLKHWQLYLISYPFSFIIQLIGPVLLRNTPIPHRFEVGNFLLYPFITTIAINSIVIILCSSIQLQFKKRDADIEIEQLKVKNLEAQKQALMQQLQPHFLFNSLSVLKSLIKENPEDAEDYTVKLSDFLRYSVESHKNQIVTLQAELQFTNDYILLQKVRFGHSFSCFIDIPEQILSDKIPVYALQTLVENAFKHNYFTEKKPLAIRISYENELIKIWNNKVSIRLTERSATGLNNLNMRYELISGKGIEIIETEDDFCVMIHLIKD